MAIVKDIIFEQVPTLKIDAMQSRVYLFLVSRDSVVLVVDGDSFLSSLAAILLNFETAIECVLFSFSLPTVHCSPLKRPLVAYSYTNTVCSIFPEGH